MVSHLNCEKWRRRERRLLTSSQVKTRNGNGVANGGEGEQQAASSVVLVMGALREKK